MKYKEEIAFLANSNRDQDVSAELSSQKKLSNTSYQILTEEDKNKVKDILFKKSVSLKPLAFLSTDDFFRYLTSRSYLLLVILVALFLVLLNYLN